MKLKLGEKVLVGFFGGIFVAGAVAILLAVQVAVEGVLIRDLWRWLILPYFPMLPELGFKAGASFSLMWHALSFKTPYPEKREPIVELKRYRNHYFSCALIYVTAYCLFRFL